MKWNFSKIVAAAAMMQLGCFCTAAAGASSSEKIGIIDEIVNTKIKEAKGADALSEVLDAVAEKFPLDTNEESPECSAYINELREQIRKKYPATDQELENKYRPIADKNYLIYNIGDQITVIFLLHGKPFTVSGPYYRQDAKFVWVGSKKILKAHLSKRHAPGFDPDQTKQLRESFVAQNIRRYHQQKDFQLKMLKSRNQEKILELRGEIKFNRKWLPPRKVVMEKYAAAFARQNNSIAESIQKAKDSPDYNEKYKILEAVIQQYPEYKSIDEVKALQEQFKQDHINSIITNAIRQAKAAQDYNEKYKILEAVIQKYPDHKAIPDIKALQERFKQDLIKAEDDLKNAKAQGIEFSSDNKTLVKCPDNLKEVIIPSCVTSIGKFAFSNCINLTKVTIPDGVTSIGQYAFTACRKLTEITIPNSVTSIGESAFFECRKLTKVTISNSVTFIGKAAFCSCSNLDDVSLPPKITVIEEMMFSDCKSLEDISIPEGVTEIKAHAFSGCKKLVFIEIPDSVTHIDYSAFVESRLMRISVPAGLKIDFSLSPLCTIQRRKPVQR